MKKTKETKQSEELAVASALATESAVAPLIPSYGEKPERKLLYSFFKRLFDIVSSGLMMIVLALPIAVCLIIKWLEDVKNPAYRLDIRELSEEEKDDKKIRNKVTRKDGKVFACELVPDKSKSKTYSKSPVYSSIRVGKNGKRYKFYKIRSMCPGAEDMKQQLIDAGLNEADPPAFKMANDPRITRIGRFYRKFSIDELLQLWNIFNGTMSVVGPRSPLPFEVEQYTPYQMHRLDVKGGLLCLWQIQPDRNKLSFDDWVKLDMEYIENRSLWLDIKIIFKGAWMVLFDHSGE